MAGGVPPLPPLHATRSQRLLFLNDGAGIGDCATLGLEADGLTAKVETIEYYLES